MKFSLITFVACFVIAQHAHAFDSAGPAGTPWSIELNYNSSTEYTVPSNQTLIINYLAGGTWGEACKINDKPAFGASPGQGSLSQGIFVKGGTLLRFSATSNKCIAQGILTAERDLPQGEIFTVAGPGTGSTPVVVPSGYRLVISTTSASNVNGGCYLKQGANKILLAFSNAAISLVPGSYTFGHATYGYAGAMCYLVGYLVRD